MAVGGGGVSGLFFVPPATSGTNAAWLQPGVLESSGVPIGGVSIGGTVVGGTPGSVLFIDGSGNLGQDNANFFWNDSTDSLIIGNGSSTVTASSPLFDGAQTWNNVASTFTGIKLNITNTASSSSSLLQDWEVGGISLLSVGVSGNLIFSGTATLDYNTTTSGAFTLSNNLFIGGESVQNPLQERANRIAPWDDFDVADGTSLTNRVSPSRFTWSTTGTGASGLIITNQGVHQNGASVGYGYMSDTGLITQCECVVSWVPGSAQSGFSSGNTVLAFSGQNGGNLLNYLLHLQVNAQTWNLLKTTTGAGGLVPLANPPVEVNGITGNAIGVWFGTNLKIDGTRYKIRMTVNQSAGILTLYLPDGLTLQYTDPDITTIMAACQTAFIEPDPDGITTQATVYVNGFGIGPSKAGDVIEASSSKDTAIVRQLYATLGATAGNGGYSPRQEAYQMFTGTTTGWYTIATESIDTSHVKMGGIVTLFGRDVAGRQVFQKIHVGYQSANGVPYYMFWTECFFNSVSGSSVIDFLRLSADDTGHHIQLDIHINDASPSTTNIFCNYEGYFTPVAAPVVGASALATWNQVLANQGAYYSYLPQMGNPGQVGDLPPAADVPVGTPAFVTNSNATLAAGLGNTVASGGANKVPVYSDGTNWIIG